MYLQRKKTISKKSFGIIKILHMGLLWLGLLFCTTGFSYGENTFPVGMWQNTEGYDIFIFEPDGSGREIYFDEDNVFSWELMNGFVVLYWQSGEISAWEYSLTNNGEGFTQIHRNGNETIFEKIDIEDKFPLLGKWIREDGRATFFFMNYDIVGSGEFSSGISAHDGTREEVLWNIVDNGTLNIYLKTEEGTYNKGYYLSCKYNIDNTGVLTLNYGDNYEVEWRYYKEIQGYESVDNLVGAWVCENDVHYCPRYLEFFFGGRYTSSDINQKGKYYVDVGEHLVDLGGYLVSDKVYYFDVNEDDKLILYYSDGYRSEYYYTFHRVDTIDGEFDTPAMKKEDLIGHWTGISAPDKYYGLTPRVLIFYEDGTYVSSMANMEGIYSVDGERHRMLLEGYLVGDETCYIDLDGDRMILYSGEYKGDSYVTYTREK